MDGDSSQSTVPTTELLDPLRRLENGAVADSVELCIIESLRMAPESHKFAAEGQVIADEYLVSGCDSDAHGAIVAVPDAYCVAVLGVPVGEQPLAAQVQDAEHPLADHGILYAFGPAADGEALACYDEPELLA